MAAINYRFNCISKIKQSGTIYSRPNEVKAVTREFFAELFKNHPACQFSLHGILFQSLSPEESSSLTLPFSTAEIYDILMIYNSSKSPGPDGFNFYFYKRAWLER